MSAAPTDSKQPTTVRYDQPPASPQHPTCYMTSGPTSLHFGGPGSDPSCYQQSGYNGHVPMMQPGPGPTVMVTQPVVVANPIAPMTTCALVMSAVSAVFCGFWCGAAGILIAWKAKLQVLEMKYEQARHSVQIVWLFFLLAMVFGTVAWGGFGIFLYISTRRYYYY